MNPRQPKDLAAEIRGALARQPNVPELHLNLGVALAAEGKLDDAIASFEKAVQLRPNYAGAYVNLGSALRERDEPDRAIAAARKALEISPYLAIAWNNLGVALGDRAEFSEALAAFRRAVELKPDFAGAHLNLAMFQLLLGDFEFGWRENEWRWAANRVSRPFPQPQWDGGDLNGRSIVLYGEQGLGDVLQFVRYAPLVTQCGGRVTVVSPPPLAGLLAQLPGIQGAISSGQPMPAFDRHCPLMSLPLIFWKEFGSLANSIPYLKADSARAQSWAKLVGSDERLKVGLAWAGSSLHKNDRRRSLMLSQFAPLADVSGVMFHSLQKEAPAGQTPPQGLPWIDQTGQIVDFSDTAALIENLDLVISVDTSIVHLAGAMSKRVWVLLPFLPDWRWQCNREDSPWYPTMRLFRQPKMGDWTSVIEAVARELKSLVNSG